MELPGTLVQDVVGVQHRVAPEQLVVHIVWARAELVTPSELARVTTAKRPARIRIFRIDLLLSLGEL
jgi:hypothetical protein